MRCIPNKNTGFFFNPLIDFCHLSKFKLQQFFLSITYIKFLTQWLALSISTSKQGTKTETRKLEKWDSQTGSVKWCVCVCACALSHSVVSDTLRPLWTVTHQALLSMEFSRQEYWSRLPFPPSGDLPRNRTLVSYISCLAGRFFTAEPPRKPLQVTNQAWNHGG